MGTTYRGVKGSKLTIAEGDDSREWTSEAGTKAKGEDLTFDRSGGWFHATSGDPETGVLTIDETVGINKAGTLGAIPGAWVMFYYSGSANPTFTGNTGAVTAYQTITTAGTYECWMARKGDGTYSLNIPQAASGGTDTTPPTVTSMSVEDASPNNLVVNLSSACTFTNIGYTFRVNGVARTLTSVSGNGTNTATFLISGAAILNTDSLDLAYDSTTGDTIKTSNSVELVTFAATTDNVTNNVAPVTASIINMDFSTESVGAYTKTAIVSGTPTIVDDSGSKLQLESGGTAQAVTSDAPSAAWETHTSLEFRLENVKFPVLAAGVNYLWGALGNTNSEGFYAQLDSTGLLTFNPKIDGTNNVFTSSPAAVSAATLYTSVSFRMVDNAANLDCDILVNDVSVGSLTINGKNISDITLSDLIYIGGRNLSGSFDGNDIDMTVEKFRVI